MRPGQRRTGMSRLSGLMGVALLLTYATAGTLANPAPSAHPQTNASVDALALQWFAEMRAGKIDRSELSRDYSAQLTADAVRAMSHYLKEYQYAASPTGAHVLLTRSAGDQMFYVVKLVFPRGDAASLLFGFDAQGKITGISLMSMAGD
jgi:hypothetical protein